MDSRSMKRMVLKGAAPFIPNNLSATERSEYLRLVVVIFGGMFIALSYFPFYHFWDHPAAYYGKVSAAFTLFTYGTALIWVKRGRILLANCQVVIVSLINLAVAGVNLGKDMNLHLYLPLVACCVILIHPKKARWLALVYGLLGLALLIFMQLFLPDHPLVGPPLAEWMTRIATVQVVCFTYVSLMGFMWWFQVHLERMTEALAQEKARSEDLLLNILPSSIAERLMTSNEAIADGFESVTVLFADIVNFSEISQQLKPRELVTYLNEVFTRFDQLTHDHGLEKIKTIGDAYMVAGGIPQGRADHAEAVLRLGMDMLQYIDQMQTPAGAPLKIRIGINSGPVIAGVIGLKKFIYDLWGDTVNLASRMESHGLVNRIQVSEATWLLLKDSFAFEEREPIAMKGVGPVRTWLLKNPSAATGSKAS